MIIGVSNSSLFFKFLHFFFLLEDGYIFAFQSFLDFLSEALDSSIEQKQVIESFFKQFGSVLHPCFFIEVVKNDDFVLLVLVVVELGDVLISFDVGAWEIHSLSYVVFLVFVGLAEIDQQEIGLEADGQLFGFDCD